MYCVVTRITTFILVQKMPQNIVA